MVNDKGKAGQRKVKVEAIGDRILKERKKAGLSALKLAKAVGISHVQLMKYEKNENMPPLERLQKISAILNCSYDYLLNGGADSSESFSFEDAVHVARENLGDADKKRVAEYINLLHFKGVFEKLKKMDRD